MLNQIKRIYKAAVNEPETVETDRAVSVFEMLDDVYETVALADMAEEEFSIVIDVFYDATSQQFQVLLLRDGELYTLDVQIRDNDIILGEMSEVDLSTIKSTERRAKAFNVHRTSNGELRWVSISSVATLNRVGEIDSTKLFDSFIAYAQLTNQFPDVTIYHLGERSIVGKADFLARDGYAYITSGTLFPDRFGEAIFQTLVNDFEGKWGDSIEFLSLDSHLERFNVDGKELQIRIHDIGINTGISIVMERDAASVGTAHISRGGNIVMELEGKLLELFQNDPELVEEFKRKLQEVNGMAEQRISRTAEVAIFEDESATETESAETETVVEEVAEEVEVTEEAETETETVEEVANEVVLDESFVSDLVGSAEFQDALRSILNAEIGKLTSRIAALEKEAETTRDWLEDVPASAVVPKRTKSTTTVSYRPRQQAADVAVNENVSLQERASDTLAKILQGGM